MKMIDLRGMDRDGLHQLAFTVQQIGRAMAELDQLGGPVTVSMVPGEQIHVQCDSPLVSTRPFVLAGTDAIALVRAEFSDKFSPGGVVFPVGIEPETPEFTDPAPPAVSPGDEARAPSDGGQASAVAGEDPEPGTPLAVAAAEGAEPVMPGGAVGNAAGHPPAADDEAHGGRPPLWTAEETETGLSLVVQAVLDGHSANSAAPAVAEATGRSLASVQLRIKTKWKDDISARVNAARNAQLDAELAEEAKAEGVTETPKVERNLLPDDDLTRHLRGVSRKGWPIRDDIDLVKFAFDGWGVSEMRLELKRDEKSIKERRRVLTSDNRFKLKDVLARLKEIEAEAA